MFTFIGIVLIVIGFGTWGLLFTGIVSDLPFEVPLDYNSLMMVLVGVGILGVIFLIIGRRPAD